MTINELDKISLVVPKYKELSVKKIWKFVKDEEDVMVYFSDYKETELPPRDLQFFLNKILITKKQWQN